MTKPMFVKVEEYEDVHDIIRLVKAKVKEAKDTLSEIEKLKRQEETELGAWGSQVDDVEKKIEFIEQTLFEAGE